MQRVRVRHTVEDVALPLPCDENILCFILQLTDVSSLPSVRELVKLRPGERDHHLALVHWVLSSKSFAVKTLQKDEVDGYNRDLLLYRLRSLFTAYCLVYTRLSALHQYAKLCNLTENEGISTPVPDFLFELEYCDQMNARFEKMRADRDLFYAFHGSRLENFHSIIHNGLHCHLNKVSAGIPASSVLFILHLYISVNC